jgi:restriction system protein
VARKREHPLNLLTEVPWWVSVIVSGAIYIILRWVLPSIEFQNLMLKNIAAATPKAAWIFALLLLVPGLVSFVKRKERQHLLDSRSDLDSIRKLSWSDFELLIGEAFRRQGYSVEERGGSAPDGGVDLVLRKGGQKTLVQCKHWKSQQVGVPIVRELLGAMTAQGASGAIVVTAGGYTAEARAFARDNRMRLIDGPELAGMIDATMKESIRREPAMLSALGSADPKCSKCGSAMAKRVAKGGANVGQTFWGCSTFPKCRGTRPV